MHSPNGWKWFQMYTSLGNISNTRNSTHSADHTFATHPWTTLKLLHCRYEWRKMVRVRPVIISEFEQLVDSEWAMDELIVHVKCSNGCF